MSAASVNRPAVRTPANPLRRATDGVRPELDTLRAGKANLRIEANSSENIEHKRDFLLLVRDAMREADLSQKAFAINAKQSESVISEALGGTRNLSADWLYAQPDRFVQILIDKVSIARNLTAESKAALQRARILELIGLLLERTA